MGNEENLYMPCKPQSQYFLLDFLTEEHDPSRAREVPDAQEALNGC